MLAEPCDGLETLLLDSFRHEARLTPREPVLSGRDEPGLEGRVEFVRTEDLRASRRDAITSGYRSPYQGRPSVSTPCSCTISTYHCTTRRAGSA